MRNPYQCVLQVDAFQSSHHGTLDGDRHECDLICTAVGFSVRGSTLSKRMTVLSMAAPSVDRRALPEGSPSLAVQSNISSAAAGPCSSRSDFNH